jgi:pimeloyl-ACP methyl ester carboxylesterase
MNHLKLWLSILLVGLLSAVWASAQTPPVAPNIRFPVPRVLTRPDVPNVPLTLQPLQRAQAARLPDLATADASQSKCLPDATALGAVCGYVKVPLDRNHPGRARIAIYFELYAHSAPGPAESAILANFGGPGGGTTTSYRYTALYVFGPNLDVHDLLLIDDRGRGMSGAIDCPEIQQGIGPLAEEVADCAAQLGNAASRYGTGDIAQDTDAVRAALGYEKVDYYGGSYGGADVTAYATRFGRHLRSIVLDAPYGAPALNQFAFERDRIEAQPRVVSLNCERSPTCSADHPLPRAEFFALVSRIRSSPLEGKAYDANGNLGHVRINENTLLNYVIMNPLGIFASTGELLAAAASLWRGDPAPLLRLGAEGYFPLTSDSGDPTIFSVGAYEATYCLDAELPWDWSAPVSQRKHQYAEAVDALPNDFFAPFSKDTATGLPFGAKDCLWWEKPTPSSPVAEAGARYPHVPTLILDGDMDQRVPFEETTEVAELFPNSTFVPVAGAGHATVLWGSCGATLASKFIETLRSGDISCALAPFRIWPALGRFPLFAKDARAADVDPRGANEIGIAERRVANVVVATATDALNRSLLIYFSGGSGGGVGLRAGTFTTTFDEPPGLITVTLADCAFAKDVVVSGSVTWGGDHSFLADLTVTGPGTAGGTLHVSGFKNVPGPVGNYQVTGTLGGKRVAVLVPEA